MSSENNSVNSIVKRIYIAADVELASPLSISNGTAENTDSDVLKMLPVKSLFQELP